MRTTFVVESNESRAWNNRDESINDKSQKLFMNSALLNPFTLKHLINLEGLFKFRTELWQV